MAEPHQPEPARGHPSFGSASMSIEVVGKAGARTVVRVSGHLDGRVAPRLARELASAARSPRRSPPRLALDLSGVTYVDGACLQVLLDLQERLAAEYGELELLSPTAAVVRLLHEADLRETSGPVGVDRATPRAAPNGSPIDVRIIRQFH